MQQYKKRALGEEALFANRQAEDFYAHARSLHRLGEWAASQMGEDVPAIKDYASMLVKAGIAGENVPDTVEADLRSAGCESDADKVESLFKTYLCEARRKATR